MKNYDCMQGFLQLIIIFFMQEIGGNINFDESMSLY